MQEHADKLIETLDLPEMQITEVADDDDLLETLVVEVPAAPESTATPDTTSTASEKPPEPKQRQLSTSTHSLSAASTTTVSNNAPPNALTLLSALGNQA